MIRFLGTKIGTALLAALIIIGLATYAKLKDDAPKLDTAAKVGLIADSSVDRAIEAGNLEQSDWEEALRRIQGSSTIDTAIASLSETASSSTTTAQPLTATDRFAQRFFTEYVRLQKNGATIDEEASLRLVNRLLAEDYGSPAGERMYAERDISVLSSNSAIEFRKYANSLASAFSQETPDDYENELAILNRVADTENNADLQKLAQNIAHYEKVRAEILAVAVPQAFRSVHLTIINSLSAMIEGVRGMQLLSTDPVGATKMVLRYEDGIKALDLAIAQLSTALKQSKVAFSASDAGYIFIE